MSPIALVLLAFLSTALSVTPRWLRSTTPLNVLQSQIKLAERVQLQAVQDPACAAWLNSSAGQSFTECQALLNNAPVRTPKFNCTLNTTDYDVFCNDTCYPILMAGYNTIIAGTCLSFFEELWAPCKNDTDCASDGSSICSQGTCFSTCKSTNDCNNCSESCDLLAERNITICHNNLQIQTSGNLYPFQGMVYSLKSVCAKNFYGTYCGVLINSPQMRNNFSTANCSQFAGWDCCLGTILHNDQYCSSLMWNNSAIYQCPNSNSVCAPLPDAKTYCSNNTNNTSPISSVIGSLIGSSTSSTSSISSTSSTSSVSSTSSSTSSTGASGSPTSTVIVVPGQSSQGVTIFPNGTIGTGNNGGTGGNGAGKETAPWLLVFGLMCTLLFSS